MSNNDDNIILQHAHGKCVKYKKYEVYFMESNNLMLICFVISGLTIFSYIWGKLTMATTAVISMSLFLITGCVTPANILSNFGNNNVIMVLSMFVVAAGFNRTKFVKTCAEGVNRFARGNLTAIMLGYVAVTVMLSQFVLSPAVVIGIMAPLLIASANEIGVQPSKVVMPLAMSSIITTGALPVGSGATVFGELNAYLQTGGYTEAELATMGVTVFDPMIARLPILIILALYCIFVAPKLAPNESVISAKTETRAAREVKPLAPFQEKCGYIIFFATTVALIFSKQVGLPTWAICMIGAGLTVLTGVLSEREATEAIPFWMGVLIVGSLTMGSALENTGAGDAIGTALASALNGIDNPYIIGLIFFIVPFLLTQAMSNRAVMMLFIPISAIACRALGANPVGIAILVQQACLAAFMTPMATPAVPQFMALGGYDLKSVFKQSIIPAAIMAVLSVGWIMTMFPMYS